MKYLISRFRIAVAAFATLVFGAAGALAATLGDTPWAMYPGASAAAPGVPYADIARAGLDQTSGVFIGDTPWAMYPGASAAAPGVTQDVGERLELRTTR